MEAPLPQRQKHGLVPQSPVALVLELNAISQGAAL